jgi:hypothetical protein
VKQSTNWLQRTLTFPFYAVLFGIFPFLVLWAENRLQIAFQAVIPVFLLTLGGVVVFWLFACLLFRSVDRGSSFSLFIFLLFFSFGHVYNLVAGKKVVGIEVGYIKLFALYAAVLVLGVVFFILRKKVTNSATPILNVISLLLVLLNVVQITIFQVRRSADRSVLDAPVVTADRAQEDLPDVYYIILDAYARGDFLLERYGYDNSAFLQGLEERGFQVADCSNSNYDGTLSSIASSLNYEYLNYYDIPDDELSEGNGDIVSLIGKNRVREELDQYGYQFVTTRGYSAFNDVRDSDLYLNVLKDPALQYSLQRSQFARLFLSTTLVRIVFEVYTANPSEYPAIPYWFELASENEFLDSSTFWYNQTRYVFDELEKLPETVGNYFVYAHINAPHGPYVFDQQGKFRYIKPTDDKEEYYVDTVIYLNARVLELVDTLQRGPGPQPIIIIQADHGSHIVTGGFDKHKILNAYYLPGSDFQVSETVTPVNTFRIVLNEYFGTELELLPDEIFVKRLNKREIFPSQCNYGD